MAKDQAERVHEGVSYDIVVDTTDTSTEECASLIVATLTSDQPVPAPDQG
jgi:chloramphenicol 3-O-phosphotransferase